MASVGHALGATRPNAGRPRDGMSADAAVLRTVLWLSEQEPGSEYVVLWRTAKGYRVHGDWVGSVDRAPSRAWYQLDIDDGWGVQRLRAAWRTPTALARLHLHYETDGGWRVNGQMRPDLTGCRDIDLAWSPLTNTLPIRRLGLAVGEQQEISVAYIAGPRLGVVPDGQRYTRVAARRWRYESLDTAFVAELTVDDEGLVLAYPPLFRRGAS